MPVFSSRPDEDDDLEDTFSLEDLVPDELELIAALLYNCTLGSGVSPYRDAAYNLMNKIEAFTNDTDYCVDAAENVDVHIQILDDDANHIEIVDKEHFEILV